jgi:hypothetical protein
VNYDVLDWVEKTVRVLGSRLSHDQKTTGLLNPEDFMGHLADGILVGTLAARLNPKSQ